MNEVVTAMNTLTGSPGLKVDVMCEGIRYTDALGRAALELDVAREISRQRGEELGQGRDAPGECGSLRMVQLAGLELA